MATKIKLIKMGKKNSICYRIIVTDSSLTGRGKIIERIGTCLFKMKNSKIIINKKRVCYWLSNGVKLTSRFKSLLKKIID